MNNFLERLNSGEILVADRATGSNLQKMGLRPGQPPGDLIIDNPDILFKLESSFVEAGSDIILTCTFGGTRMRMKDSKYQDRAPEVNMKAAELARKAASAHETYVQELQMPDGWHAGDNKVVCDTIVEMTYRKQTVSQTTVYITQLWFVYLGTKWSNTYQGHGDSFNVPDSTHDGWLEVNHGLFAIEVSSATNLSAHYDIGDVITVQSTLLLNGHGILGFGQWSVKGTI